MKRLALLVIVLMLTGCQAGTRYCPEPKTVKLRKASFNRMKWYQTQLEQRSQAKRESMAKREQLLLVSNREQKKAMDVEEWDCPRPGTRHEKLVRKSRKRTEKQHIKSIKKRNDLVDAEAPPSF